MKEEFKSRYKIRSARKSELHLLADIERSAGILFSDTVYSFLVSAEPLHLNFVERQFDLGLVWVAVDCLADGLHQRDDPVVGYAIAAEVDDTLYLQQIDVAPHHGRRGIGSRLVGAVCALAKERGYRLVSLSTFRDIPWNAPFYAKLGFRPLCESELTPGFQQIRLKEAKAGLPIVDRVIMQYEVV
jgi:ribosomal protein S18 acetylase RimI-like enzyme